MPLPKKITNFLEKNKTRYEIIEHKTVYTSFDKAKTLKVRPAIIGKTLFLRIDKELAIVLISADKNLDKGKFKKVVNKKRKKEGKKAVKKIEFASEKLMKNKIKGARIGVIPPFGNLFGFPTFVSKSLLNKPNLILNSGDYNFSIKIRPSYLKKILPDLIVGSFTKSRK